MAEALGRHCESGLEEHQYENCRHQRIVVDGDIGPLILSISIFIIFSSLRIILPPALRREARQFLPFEVVLRSPLSVSRKRISPRGATSLSCSFFPSRSPPTFVKTGNYTGLNTGKKKTRDELICASNYAPARKTKAFPGVDGYGGFHGDGPSTLEEPTPIGILKDPPPEQRTRSMTPLQSDVAPVRPPVRPSPARHLAAAPLPASTCPTNPDPVVPILVAVAATTQAAVSVGENSDRRFPVTARRSAG